MMETAEDRLVAGSKKASGALGTAVENIGKTFDASIAAIALQIKETTGVDFGGELKKAFAEAAATYAGLREPGKPEVKGKKPWEVGAGMGVGEAVKSEIVGVADLWRSLQQGQEKDTVAEAQLEEQKKTVQELTDIKTGIGGIVQAIINPDSIFNRPRVGPLVPAGT